uniref:Target of myb1 membrane trafficking protein n=1 Tax=Macaca mulatta TaxID=9544 RepID=A0A1D5QK42_MACMU
MDFLLGNPFSSPVGQRIEKATDGSLQSEDWALNMEICDIINETEEGPKDALRAVKKRIVGNKNFHEVLETCVKNCGHRFHVLVASQDFVESVLVRTILPKNNPPTIVHDKVLNLIQLRSELEMVSGNVRVMSEMLTELVPTQACLMEDIEQWLSTDVGNDAEEPKGVTSEEFDKFLEERAKAADRLPNLSSPSAEGPPGPPPGPAPRKKTQEKDDDMLFAL